MQRTAASARRGRRAANRLALIRAFCAPWRLSTLPQRHPVHNFFWRREGGCCGRHRAGEDARGRRKRAPAGGKIKKFNVAETHISSAFPSCGEFFAQSRSDENSLRAPPRRRTWRASRAAAGGGAYTQN